MKLPLRDAGAIFFGYARFRMSAGDMCCPIGLKEEKELIRRIEFRLNNT